MCAGAASLQNGRASAFQGCSHSDHRRLAASPSPGLGSAHGPFSDFERQKGVCALQDEQSIFGGAIGTGSGARSVSASVTALVLLGVGLLLLVHCAAFVLPVYALTAASVSFSSQDGLLRMAQVHGVEPHLVEFLQDTHKVRGASGDAVMRT